MSLSDACSNCVNKIWEHGATTEVLKTFRSDVSSYNNGSYPAEVCELLIDAVDEFNAPDHSMKITPSVFLGLLALTRRALDGVSPMPKAELIAILNKEWPVHAGN